MFGCNAFVHIPGKKRKKLDKKSIRCIFVGYPAGCKGYKHYNPETSFMETSFRHKVHKGQKNPDLLIDYFKQEIKYEESEDSVGVLRIPLDLYFACYAWSVFT